MLAANHGVAAAGLINWTIGEIGLNTLGTMLPSVTSQVSHSRLCRDCGRLDDGSGEETCTGCGSARLIAHPELSSLSIAHVDCDAYYASIEKRDHPELIDKPLIVGGSIRGVVTTACYIARQYGVRS